MRGCSSCLVKPKWNNLVTINFINVKRTNFTYESAFRHLFLLTCKCQKGILYTPNIIYPLKNFRYTICTICLTAGVGKVRAAEVFCPARGEYFFANKLTFHVKMSFSALIFQKCSPKGPKNFIRHEDQKNCPPLSYGIKSTNFISIYMDYRNICHTALTKMWRGIVSYTIKQDLYRIATLDLSRNGRRPVVY